MYRFIRIGNTNLICYHNGTILRFWKQTKKWKICGTTKNAYGYLQIEIDGKGYKCHRIIAFAFGILKDLHLPLEIDHRDRNKINNCIFNLRVVSSQQNNFNRGDFKGYHQYKNKWVAQIGFNKKHIYLGIFNTEEEAHQAYLDAKKTYHKY